MKLRRFIINTDFDEIKNWINDERTHAMWCANLINYPLDKDNLEWFLRDLSDRCGDTPYVATTDDGKVIGFFCCSVNPETNEGMLKFVMVSTELRGQGIGKEMLSLACKYAFEKTTADLIQLNVFSENTRAQRCYKSVGFAVRNNDADAFRFKDETWGRCNMILKRV